jgi:hypothetical protein
VTQNDYVIGLLLALIVLSAIPVFATGVLWVSLLLLLMVWTYVYQQKGSL